MDTLTDRERELVEAAKELWECSSTSKSWQRFESALRAYDPPKARKYTMPEWSKLPASASDYLGDNVPACLTWLQVSEVYNYIREALSTEEE